MSADGKRAKIEAFRRRVQVVRRGEQVGRTPAIVMDNPGYAFNVCAMIRAAACFGVEQVWFTGQRIWADIEKAGRLPREERIRDYDSVTLFNTDYYPLDCFPSDSVPVAVELRDGCENLYDFIHPENAIYVFGPEDGSVRGGLMARCHRVVKIPTLHCVNLGAAGYLALYDRDLKDWHGFFGE